jgi:light-regulated signal transduction histidine kinase (bacteriophytochrome)
VLGQTLPEQLAALLQALPEKVGCRMTLEAAMPGVEGMLDLTASRNEQGAVVVELTRYQPALLRPFTPPLHESPRDAAALADAQDVLVRRVAGLTGFRRVMYYRFREEGDGEVIAEARGSEAFGSYLGLRFPASDIPMIARALYLKNPWRLIPDAAADPVALLGREPTPPDLTYSDLRSVSPVHRVYLANMGVRASLSFPVVVGGDLTALIACHHDSPRQPSLALLDFAAQLARGHAMAVMAYQSSRRMRLLDGLAHRFDAARALLQRHGGALSAWSDLGAWLMGEFQVDGATLCLGESCTSTGTSLEPAALAAFDQWFRRRQGDSIWSGNSLTRQVPDFPLSQVAGVLALRLMPGEGRELRIYLCRLEHIHEVAWGGNPDKPVEYHDGAIGIAPRRSFETWLEKRLGYSRGWNNETRLLALKLRELLQRELHP